MTHAPLSVLIFVSFGLPRLPTLSIRDAQEQVTKLICGILFHAWRQHVINPLVREKRKNRPESKSAWVQRMMAPKTKAARGGGNGEGGRLDETSGVEDDCNVASTSEQEVGRATMLTRERPERKDNEAVKMGQGQIN